MVNKENQYNNNRVPACSVLGPLIVIIIIIKGHSKDFFFFFLFLWQFSRMILIENHFMTFTKKIGVQLYFIRTHKDMFIYWPDVITYFKVVLNSFHFS